MSGLQPGEHKVGRGATAVTMQPIEDGVWLMRGGFPARTFNIYFIEEDDGVTVFDAGIRGMTRHVAEVGRVMGGIKRILLSHAHADHRGAAPGAGAPVWCHEADAADAAGDGGIHYMDLSKLPRWTKAGPTRAAYPLLMRIWDGGPVRVDRTVAEGDTVAGFEVVHLPGHAPGLIGLWRARDRLALVSDCFYTLDPTTGDYGPPRVAHAAFNFDTAQARESIRKLASLEPRIAWPGHAEPVRGEVRATLESVADATL